MRGFHERRAVLFDLDGTLIDSTCDIAAALGDVLSACGLEPLSLETVRALIGDGAAVLLARAFAARGVVEPPDALPSFLDAYDRRCLEGTVAFPGMAELVRDLHAAGRALGVVTNKPTRFSVKILEGLGLAAHFAAVVGPDLAQARKPDPAHVLATLAAMGAGAEEAVLVGDGPADVVGGRDAGVATIAVAWGNRDVEELAGLRPDSLVRDVASLRDLLLGPSSADAEGAGVTAPRASD